LSYFKSTEEMIESNNQEENKVSENTTNNESLISFGRMRSSSVPVVTPCKFATFAKQQSCGGETSTSGDQMKSRDQIMKQHPLL